MGVRTDNGSAHLEFNLSRDINVEEMNFPVCGDQITFEHMVNKDSSQRGWQGTLGVIYRASVVHLVVGRVSFRYRAYEVSSKCIFPTW